MTYRREDEVGGPVQINYDDIYHVGKTALRAESSSIMSGIGAGEPAAKFTKITLQWSGDPEWHDWYIDPNVWSTLYIPVGKAIVYLDAQISIDPWSGVNNPAYAVTVCRNFSAGITTTSPFMYCCNNFNPNTGYSGHAASNVQNGMFNLGPWPNYDVVIKIKLWLFPEIQFGMTGDNLTPTYAIEHNGPPPSNWWA